MPKVAKPHNRKASVTTNHYRPCLQATLTHKSLQLHKVPAERPSEVSTEGVTCNYAGPNVTCTSISKMRHKRFVQVPPCNNKYSFTRFAEGISHCVNQLLWGQGPDCLVVATVHPVIGPSTQSQDVTKPPYHCRSPWWPPQNASVPKTGGQMRFLTRSSRRSFHVLLLSCIETTLVLRYSKEVRG